ncbi:MAG: sulfate adenylyltransferase [Chloroflexota bacterium]|nr:sulfate adenylyltransferase [Chloroflexota bacterium]
MTTAATTIEPHGGTLVDRMLRGDEREAAIERLRDLPSVTLGPVAISDLRLIANGAFSPLTGFLGLEDYRSVVEEMHLRDGTVWSMPVSLPVTADDAGALSGDEVALVDESGAPIGLLQLVEQYEYDKEHEAETVFSTADAAHPGVARIYAAGDVYLGGEVWLVNAPTDLPFADLQLSPQQTRQAMAERGWRRVVGFQTRNPVHRAHEYIQKAALEAADGLLLHPLVGETKADDVPADVRIRSYRRLLEDYYPADRTLLAVYPAAMRYGGPREAIFHALARKNYGCTHFIVGRDHAGVGSYYGTYDAQQIFDRFTPDELGIVPLFFEHTFWCRRCEGMASYKTCPHGDDAHLILSGSMVREMLTRGELPPPEFTRPEVAEVLFDAYRDEAAE